MRNGLDCSFKFGVPDYDFSTKNKEQEMPKTSQGLARASDYIHITTVYLDGVF